MNNYIEYNDGIAFHPGYYIKEIVDESGLTQEDFAKRLGTTPKNLSILIRGEQRLSIEMASRLSRMLGTTVAYWLSLQQAYDEKYAEYLAGEEMKIERATFSYMDYKYFRDHFDLPDLPRQIDEQIAEVRGFMRVSSLSVLEERDFAVKCHCSNKALSKSSIINSNAMVQIAINKVLDADMPCFNKRRFEKKVEYAMALKETKDNRYSMIQEAFKDTGVALVVLPNMSDSDIIGATKRVNGRMMLMLNDINHNEEALWLALFQEISHILNGNLGLSLNIQ